MTRRLHLVALFVALGLMGKPASAQLLQQLLSGGSTSGSTTTQQGVIVRTNLGLLGLQNICLLNGCSVSGNLDDNQNQLFLVRPILGLLPNLLEGVLRLIPGILDVEVDQSVRVPTNPSTQPQASAPPGGLWDHSPVSYYGTQVPDGYVNQPAVGIIRLAQAHSTFHISGSGIIADIDTGVDPNHPALKSSLLAGYDFTRNQPGGSEMTDIGVSGTSYCSTSNPCSAANVNQHTVAMLDQHTAAMMDGTTKYAAFGHGTMVAGILHLVAPTAKILPLKSFRSDGSANLSDILRAVYYATDHKANVINMSFNLTSPSPEMVTAINYAANKNVISVASSGNDGLEEVVYPAALKNVMGVASTNNSDQRSTFSNYGNQIVWVAAPGEAIVTTYPFGFYAAGWGTSFSSPFVAGTASLVYNVMYQDAAAATVTQTLNSLSQTDQSIAAWAISHAKYIGPNMGNGRLDVYNSLGAIVVKIP